MSNRQALSCLLISLVLALVATRVYNFSSFSSETLGVDFPALLSAAKIASLESYDSVYNTDIISIYQSQLKADKIAFVNAPADLIMPFAYLPAYVSLATLLPYDHPFLAFFIFSSIKIIFLVWYLYRASKTLVKEAFYIALLTTLSVPVIYDFVVGNVGVFIGLIFFELLLAERSSSAIRSGFLAAISSIKLQLLPSSLLAYILLKRWQSIKYFSIGLFIICSLSLILAGVQGISNLFLLLLNYKIEYGSGAGIMINWRMVSAQLEHLGSHTYFTNFVFYAGIVSTLVLVCVHFLNSTRTANQSFIVIMLANSLLLSHYHVHAACVIAFALPLLVHDQALTINAAEKWLAIPALTSFSIALIDMDSGYLFGSMAVFIANFILLFKLTMDQLPNQIET